MTTPTLADEIAALRRAVLKLSDFIREHSDPGAGAFACEHEAEGALARLEAMQCQRPVSLNTHPYIPDPKYPWFCASCGYAQHEQLQHPSPSEPQEGER